MVYVPRAIPFNETTSLFPKNCQLPRVLHLGMRLDDHNPSLCWDIVWLELEQVLHTLSQTLSVGIYLASKLCQGNTVSL